MLFIATTVNYLDRQVLSLTWKDFIAPEFHWTDSDYGSITAVFSIVYAVANLFAGKFIDWIGTRRGYTVAIGVWSVGACLHALCGWATEHSLGLQNVGQMLSATGAIASAVAITSVYYFIAARIVLGIGEAGNFPAAAREIYDRCNELLSQPGFSARGLMQRYNVEAVCTTDDPIDSLEYHRAIRESGFAVKVLPAWRPDKATLADNPQVYNSYIDRLAEAAGIDISSYSSLIQALRSRHDYFASQGCSVADHGVTYFP